ncbi:MAG: NUDIX domain-containing protein [Promethearchaeota archaeon]|jgi:ADP-ribose pyrophosphatase YjhB (NUDIX family)
MEENLRFIYGKEYWFVSAFINTKEFVGETKAEEIEVLLLERLKDLNENDLKKAFEFLEKYPDAEEKKGLLSEMVKSISIECDWEPYFQNFPYTDENNPYTEDNKDLIYNTLGYFKLEVEYFKNESYKKDKITPDLVQQVPIIVLEILKAFSSAKENEYLLIDTESPIYVFVISNRTTPINVQWNEENIHMYRKVLGYWAQIYSGQWGDYSDDWYEERIKQNLSNRLSELHYIKRNSGFIYMAERNIETEFFYIEKTILESTPEIRAVLFALMTITRSLDALFMKRYGVFMSLERIEQKINNLRFLRGMIQTKMSLIYSELDWNRRQHYARVLTHLINKFHIEEIARRTNDKFQMLYDSMQELYLKRNEEVQKRTKKALYYLNLIFSAGFAIEFANSIRTAFGIPEDDPPNQLMHIYLSIILGIVVVIIFGYLAYSRIKLKATEQGHTVDAVIQYENQKIVLIKRKYAPYKGKYGLPGGFIKYNEDPEQAVIREVREETNLAVEIIEKIGTYDQKGRDPRGRIVSTVFKCRLIKDLSKMARGDDAIATEAISIDKLKTMDLAFDHKQILKDAGIL